jgi:5'-3' exonuclease
VLSSAGFPCVEVRGYEADDICAWATRVGGTPARTRVRLVSRDADLYQLLHLPWVALYDPQNRVELTGAHVRQKYGVPPARFRALKVLMGCSTDNIPHPAGLGEVTAAKIVNQSLKGVLRERWISRLRGEKGVLQLSARLNHLPFEGFDRVAGDLAVALPTLRQVQADPILEFMKEMEMEGLFEHASEFWRGLSSEGLLDQPWNQRRIRVEPPMGFVDLGRFYGRA